MYEAVETFGSDIEDFLDNKVYQTSTAFSILQIGELVKRLSPELRDELGEVTSTKGRVNRQFIYAAVQPAGRHSETTGGRTLLTVSGGIRV